MAHILRGLGMMYIMFEGMEVTIHGTRTLLLCLQLYSPREEGLLGCDGFINVQSLSISIQRIEFESRSKRSALKKPQWTCRGHHLEEIESDRLSLKQISQYYQIFIVRS